jgi:hypothetical protein
MNRPTLMRRVRAVLGILAVLLSAIASIATSDCAHVDTLPAARSDSLELGQTSKRFHVRAPRAERVELSVDAALNLRATTQREGVLGEGPSAKISCEPQLKTCDDLLVEVFRTDAAEAVAFTLSVLADWSTGCDTDDSIAEVKIEPE